MSSHLLRVASRAGLKSTPLTYRAAATSQLQSARHYAKVGKPKTPSLAPTPKGPVKNQTWAPDKPIKFASTPEQSRPVQDSTVLADEAIPGATSAPAGPVGEAFAQTKQEPIIATLPRPLQHVNETDASTSRTDEPPNATGESASSQPIITTPASTESAGVRGPESSLSASGSNQYSGSTAQETSEMKATTSHPETENVSSQEPIMAPPPPQDDIRINEPLLRTTPPDMPSEQTPSSTPSEGFITDADVTNTKDIPNQAEDSPTHTGPLPDLRQGIPLSFQSSSLKDTDSAASSLDITQDPTKTAGEGGGRRGKDDSEQYYTSIDRRRFTMARWAYAAFGVFAVGGAGFFGQNWSNEEEARLHPDAPNGWDPKSFWGRIKARVAPTLGYYTEPSFPKLLPDVDPMMRPSPYTLVLSLEDLLVSSNWSRKDGWKVAKRPGVDYFIRYMTNYYELALFTTVPYMNGEVIYRKLDPFRLISWPLFREATRYTNGEHVKDLSYLNRDLSKTIIIDTVPGHVQLQPENAIILPKWQGTSDDPGTSELVALIPFLEYIASMSIDDVRKVLKSYEGKHIPTEFHRREQLARDSFNQKLADEKKSRHFGGASVWGTLGNSLGIKAPQQMAMIPGQQSPAEALSQGKMLSDQIREQGIARYQEMEKQIQMHGDEWLKEAEKEEKMMQEEAVKNMQSGMSGMFGSWFGGGGGGGGSPSAT